MVVLRKKDIYIMFNTITKEEFSKKVEGRVSETSISYIDAVLAVLEDNSLDFTNANKLITKPIIEKIQQEGRELNLLPKRKNCLPFA
jgi:hypothetical protein